MIKKPEKTRNKSGTVRAFLQNLAYVYCIITVLQTNVQQIHHKWTLVWDSEEPACVAFSRVTIRRGMSHDFPLRGVLVLLCTAAAKIHPTQVVPVCYPVAGSQSIASAVCCGVSAHRTWEEKWGGGTKRRWGEMEPEGKEFSSESS